MPPTAATPGIATAFDRSFRLLPITLLLRITFHTQLKAATLGMSRTRAKDLFIESTVAPVTSVSLFGSSYKRQKTPARIPCPVSDRDSDNEPIQPLHQPHAARLSPKRQVLQERVRRLKLSERHEETTKETEAKKSMQGKEGTRGQSRQLQTRAGAQQGQPAAANAAVMQRATQLQMPASTHSRSSQRQSARGRGNQQRTAADGGRTAAGAITLSPISAFRSAPPTPSQDLPTCSAAMRLGTKSHSRARSPSLSSDFSSTSSSASSSSLSPLSPQRLLSEWVDRRIAIKEKKGRREEQQWKNAVQHQLAQLVQQSTAMRHAGQSRQQRLDSEEDTREQRVARLEDRMERLMDSWDKTQQQCSSYTIEKRRRAEKRARHLSASGGRSDVRRTLKFAKQHDTREKQAKDDDLDVRKQQAEAGTAINDGWVRNENKLIWLLQHNDGRL